MVEGLEEQMGEGNYYPEIKKLPPSLGWSPELVVFVVELLEVSLLLL